MPKKNENMIDGQNDLNEEENQDEINENQINENQNQNNANQNNENQINEENEGENIEEYDPDLSYILDDDDVEEQEIGTILREYKEEPKRQYRPEAENQGPAPIKDTVYAAFRPPFGAVEHAADYNRLEQALMGFRPDFDNVDDLRTYGRYVSALHMLSQNLDTYSQDYETEFGKVSIGFTSKLDAWNYIHEQGSLDKVRALKCTDGKTIQEKLAETNRNTGVNFNQISATIAGEDWNPFVPEHIQTLFHGPGNAYHDFDHFMEAYRNPAYGQDLNNLTPAGVDNKLAEIRARDIAANGEPFDPERLQGTEKKDYAFFSDLKHYSDVMQQEGMPIRNEGFRTFLTFNERNAGFQRILQRHQNEEAFVRAVRAMDHLEAAYNKALTGQEIDQYVQELLNRPEIQNATTPPGTLVRAVAGGDHTKFKELLNLNPAYAELLALKHLKDQMNSVLGPDNERYTDQASFTQKYYALRNNKPQQWQEFCENHAYDPLFRHGIMAFSESVATDSLKTPLKSADADMNAKIMADTLAPLDEQQIKNLDQALGLEGNVEKITDAVEANINKQTSLAKVMFLAQLGKVSIREAEEDGGVGMFSYDRSVGNLFAHGQRVTFNLPVTENAKGIYDSIYGEDYGKEQGVYSVLSSGHDLRGQTYDENFGIDYATTIQPGLSLTNNYAMNIPVGGYGTKDLNGEIRQANSEDGKAVIKMSPGKPSQRMGATMSFGIRTPKQQNNRQTPFLTNKGGDLGDAFGGRDINIYRIKDESLINLMNRFDQYYRKLQKDALSDPEKARELNDLNRSLSGDHMGKEAMVSLMSTKLGVNAANARTLYEVNHERDDIEMTEDKWVNIPPAPNPNAGKTQEQIKKEAQEERMRMEAGVSERLNAGTGLNFERDNEIDQPVEAAHQENEPQHRTLDDYLSQKALQLMRTEKKSAQQKIICNMFSAIVQTRGNKDAVVNEAALDPKKAAKIPSVEYQLKYGYQGLLTQAITGNPNMLMKETVEMNKLLESRAEDAGKINQLRTLYQQMNVPNLKSRSKEYQRLVKAVGKASMKDSLSPEEKLSVINAVRNYADEKRVVPRTTNGKISLDLAYQAMEAVLPEADHNLAVKGYNKFKRPIELNIDTLRDAMDEAGLREQPHQQEELELQVNQNQQGI